MFEPFAALKGPLEAFRADLEFSGLSPAAAFAKAQEEFQRTVGLARGGDLDAIRSLTTDASRFLDLAGAAGSSVTVNSATAQVRNAFDGVLGRIEVTQADASRGIETQLERNRRDNVSTLTEMKDAIVDELRRLDRSVRGSR